MKRARPSGGGAGRASWKGLPLTSPAPCRLELSMRCSGVRVVSSSAFRFGTSSATVAGSTSTPSFFFSESTRVEGRGSFPPSGGGDSGGENGGRTSAPPLCTSAEFTSSLTGGATCLSSTPSVFCHFAVCCHGKHASRPPAAAIPPPRPSPSPSPSSPGSATCTGAASHVFVSEHRRSSANVSAFETPTHAAPPSSAPLRE